MSEFLIIILMASIALAVWTYWRAHKLHTSIEAIHPGFNQLMRHWRRRG